MSTAARKARKRAGIKFTKTPKVGTPFLERSWVTALVMHPVSKRYPLGMAPRSAKKIARALKARTN